MASPPAPSLFAPEAAASVAAPDVVVATMRSEDIEGVIAVDRACFRSPWSSQIYREELERAWARLDVVKEATGGRILAFANYWVVSDEVHLLNLAVHPDARRRGLGDKLLRHVVAAARREGSRTVTLEVRQSNAAAQRLYRRQGFRSVGVRPGYYADDQEDAILMTLDLP